MTHRTGSGILEILFLSALLLLFGLTTYALVAVGGDGYQRVLNKRDQNSDLRVAMSFLVNRVRQADTMDGVQLRAYEDRVILVLPTREEDEVLETRLYLHDGYLYEAYVPAEAEFNPQDGDVVSPVDSLSLTWADERKSALRIEVTRGQDAAARRYDTTVYLRAG